MLCFLWIVLLFLRLAVALRLSLPDRVSVKVPVAVNWTQDPGDPEKWDLRMTQDDADEGLVLANMNTKGASSGVKEIKFPKTGEYKLVAVVRAGPDATGFPQIGTSNLVSVVDDHPKPNGMAADAPTSTNVVSTTSSSGTTPTLPPDPFIPPPDRSTMQNGSETPSPSHGLSSINVLEIVAGILGGLATLAGAIVFFVYLRRRRRRAKTRRQVIFHRELMVQRRPGPYVASASFSFDTETGSLSDTSSHIGRSHPTPFATGSPRR